MNLTTDDVRDETDRINSRKRKSKTNNDKSKSIVDNCGNIIFSGNRLQRLIFLKKHFGLTARYTKRGRMLKVIEDNNYKVVTAQDIANS